MAEHLLLRAAARRILGPPLVALLGSRFEPLLHELFNASGMQQAGHGQGAPGAAAAAAAAHVLNAKEEARQAAEAARAAGDSVFLDALTQHLLAACMQVLPCVVQSAAWCCVSQASRLCATQHSTPASLACSCSACMPGMGSLA